MSGLFNTYRAKIVAYLKTPYDDLSSSDKDNICDILKNYFYETTRIDLPKKSFWSNVINQTGDIWMVFMSIPSMFDFAQEYWHNNIYSKRTTKQLQADATEFRKYFWGIIKSKLLSDISPEDVLTFEQKKELAEQDLHSRYENAKVKLCTKCGNKTRNKDGVCTKCRGQKVSSKRKSVWKLT